LEVLDRRGFVKSCCAGLVGLAVPSLVWGRSQQARALAFYHIHTDEWLNVTYWAQGQYLPEAMAQINVFLRDHRTGDVHTIDPVLLDTLHAIREHLGVHKTFHVISGYRSPATNAMLRQHTAGVAKHSLHMQGRAIDIRLPRFDSRQLRRAALAVAPGGVGYYPKSDFVHVDTGKHRQWAA